MLRAGYAGTGLVELLDAAGVPKGSFYNHFDSKESFGVELVRCYYAAHDELLVSLIAQSDPGPFARLRSYFDETLRRAEDASPQVSGCLLGMFALEMAGTSERLRTAVSDAFATWEARLAELLQQAQDAGELDAGQDPRQVAAMLIEGWEGALMRARVTHDRRHLRTFIDVVFAQLAAAR